MDASAPSDQKPRIDVPRRLRIQWFLEDRIEWIGNGLFWLGERLGKAGCLMLVLCCCILCSKLTGLDDVHFTEYRYTCILAHRTRIAYTQMRSDNPLADFLAVVFADVDAPYEAYDVTILNPTLGCAGK